MKPCTMPLTLGTLTTLAALMALGCTPNAPSEAPPPAAPPSTGPSVLDVAPSALSKPTFPCPAPKAEDAPPEGDGRTVYTASDGGAVDSLVTRAEAELRQSKVGKDTERALEAALRESPESVRLLTLTALINAHRGKVDLARRRALEAFQSNPNHPYVQLLLGLIKTAQGEPAASIPHFESAVEMDPGNALAQLHLGMSYLLRDPTTLGPRERDAAEGPLTRAVQLDPELEPAYGMLIGLYDRGARHAMAQSVATCGLSHLPESAMLHGLHAAESARLGERSRATASLERALELGPKDAAALTYALFTQAALGDDASAEDLHRRARRAGAPEGALAYSRACGHAIAGQTEDALRWLKAAAKAEPRWMRTATQDPDLSALRGTPEFQALVGGG